MVKNSTTPVKRRPNPTGTRNKAKARGRKKETRDRILKAAQQVFAAYPYHAASIRMIGKLAEVEHPLISYYFPSKAALFRAAITDLLMYRSQLEQKWYDSVKMLDPARGLSLFIDHVLEDFRQRPGFFHIVSLNLTRSAEVEPIPGYDIIQDYIQTSTRMFIETIRLKVSHYEAEMFARTMGVFFIGLLGASGSYAALVKMEPDSILYYNWVRDTMLYTLLPRLEKMVKAGSDEFD
jgi:TetR/AcrR family transcriptional regulator